MGSTPTVSIKMDSQKSVAAGCKEFFPSPCTPTVQVALEEDPYRFEPSEFTCEAGETLTLVLTGDREFHTFTIDELGIDIFVNAGETITQEITCDKPGTFKLICIPHEALGMVGTVTVGQTSPTVIIEEEEGILLIKDTPEYKSLVEKYSSDHVSVTAVNLHANGETDFLRKLSDGFLMEPGCIIVLKAENGEGYVYQLDEEFNIAFRMALSGFETGARNVDTRTMEKFYDSLK